MLDKNAFCKLQIYHFYTAIIFFPELPLDNFWLSWEQSFINQTQAALTLKIFLREL